MYYDINKSIQLAQEGIQRLYKETQTAYQRELKEDASSGDLMVNTFLEDLEGQLDDLKEAVSDINKLGNHYAQITK